MALFWFINSIFVAPPPVMSRYAGGKMALKGGGEMIEMHNIYPCLFEYLFPVVLNAPETVASALTASLTGLQVRIT